MKIMFLDESGDHSLEKIDKSYPMFILAGCIFDFDYYFNFIESRETHNDQKLSRIYENFRTTKNRFITTTEIQTKLVDLSFNQKMQNIVGMQIADLVVYPIGKWVLDNKAKNKAYVIIETKLHKKPRTERYLNYGLKIFP